MFRLDPTHDQQSLCVCAGNEGSFSSDAFPHRLRMHAKATWTHLLLHYKWLKHGEDPDFKFKIF